MDAAIARSVVPVIVGLVIPALRLGLPPIYETPAAVVLGAAVCLGYALAGRFPRNGDEWLPPGRRLLCKKCSVMVRPSLLPWHGSGLDIFAVSDGVDIILSRP